MSEKMISRHLTFVRNANMFVVALLFTLLTHSSCHLLLPSEEHEVTVKQLPKFSNYMLLVHFDNGTDQTTELFLKNYVNSPKCLFNYDLRADFRFRRPINYQFVNFVILSDLSVFKAFYMGKSNIEFFDLIIFILKHKDETLLLQDYENMEKAAVYYLLLNDRIYVQHRNALKPLDFYENGKAKFQIIYTNYANFMESLLRIGYHECEPYIYDALIDGQLITKGVELRILVIVAKLLNFRFQLVKYRNRTKMLEAVFNNELHLAIGCISFSRKRNDQGHLTSPINQQSYAAVYSSQNYQYRSIFALVKPFSLQVWSMWLLSVILMTFVAKAYLNYYENQDLGVFGYIIYSYQTFLEQAVIFKSKHIMMRVILSGWLLVSMIMTNAYKSQLSSSLMKPTLNEPDTIDDLIRLNYDYFATDSDHAFIREMLLSTNKTQVLDHIQSGQTDCNAFRPIFEGRNAVIDEMQVLTYYIWYKCRKFMTHEDVLTMRRIKPIAQNNHCWVLHQSGLFRERFSRTIEWLKALGIIDKWYSSSNLTGIIYSSNMGEWNSNQAMNVHVLFTPCVIYITITIVAFITFCIEIIKYKYT